MINTFEVETSRKRGLWQEALDSYKKKGMKTVVWGASSKGVSFLTTLEIDDEVECAVDINPNKRGMFIPGSGHRIVSPEDLCEIAPDIVIIMNPIYKEEIRQALDSLNLYPKILSVNDPAKDPMNPRTQ